MITDTNLADQVHILIHSLRLIPDYKPSKAEAKLNGYVIERYKDSCAECKNREEALKNQPANKKGFFARVMDIAKGEE